MSSSDETGPYPKGDPRSLPFALSRSATEISERATAVHRLASATRHVIEELMSTGAPLDAIHEAADLAERAARLLALQPHGRDDEHVGESSLSGDPSGFLEFSPVIGRSNPLAPPLHLSFEADLVIATAVFGSAYEGPPGHVHGGYIAAAFDEVLGVAQSTTRLPGMTGVLTVRYRRPTPLHTLLRLDGEVVRIEGRKIFTRGSLRAGDTLCAQAEGLFISIDFERFAEQAQRSRTVGP